MNKFGKWCCFSMRMTVRATDQNKLVERIGLVEKLIESALPIEDVKD